jgi:DNA polymerase III epsilon subunit-like protein
MIILDTETTGLLVPGQSDPDKQPRIIDIAAVKIDASGEVIEQIEYLIQPRVFLDKDITRITGLKDDDLIGKPEFPELFADIADFFLGEREMVAHNLPFDRGMLMWELIRMGREFAFPWPAVQIDTVEYYKDQFGFGPKLTQLYERKLKRKLDQRHRAMADVEALLEIVLHDNLHRTYWSI